MQIEGKVALVTGGARRVGAAVCEALAKKGARVVIHYLNSREEAEALTLKLPQALPLCCDLTKPDEIQRMMGKIDAETGPLEILVNNASVFSRTPFESLDKSAWDEHLNINLKAPYLLSLAAAKQMRKAGRGKIINIADGAWAKPYKNYLPYCVSKAGLVSLTKALAVELAPDILVNAIAPGPVLAPETYSQGAKSRSAMGTLLEKWGDPKDIANAVCFLIEGTDFATGSILTLDGGRGLQ